MKKFYSFLLATVALLCSTAANAYATTGGWSSVNTAAYDGKCGDNAYWTLDEGVLTIFGEGAMYNYANDDANRAPWYADRENISSVSIGSGITVIGEWALAGCLFTSIEFPNTLTTIKEEALSDCSALTSITIPASVTTIEDYAFACKSLATITVEAGNTTYDSRNNCNAIIETATNKLIAGSANAVIPEGITTIGTYAFERIDIKNLEIPASVTSIEEGAFAYTSLKSVKLPSAITTIEGFIFYGSKIETIEIPASVTSIGYWAFSHCYGLTSIEIPSSVTSIGEFAFISCTGLTSIVSHIAAEDLFAPGDDAFDGIDKNACTIYVPAGAKSTYAATEQWKDFTNIVEPNGKCGDNAYWALNEETGALTIFGKGAMYDYDYNNANLAPWHSNKENITSVTIEEGVTSIGKEAFLNCSGLTSIEIPSSVTSIGDDAFVNCHGLTSIEIPSSVTSIGNHAFICCSCLTSIKIPSSVKSIGGAAFNGCTGLTSIEIPAGVTSIGEYAFESCSSLTSIIVDEENTVYDSRGNCNAIIETASNTLLYGCENTVIPSSVTSIGEAAFYDCTGLTSIEIPEGVTSIGEGAFSCCYGLTSIEIPSSVTSIGDYAFNGCSGRTSIVSHITAENLFAPGDYAFDGIDKNACTLYVPAGAKSTYAATEQWKDFTNIVEFNGKCGDNAYWALNEETGAFTIFGTGAMYNYNHGETPWHSNKENITSVTIEEGVTSIGNCAFWNCSGLTSIEIPSNVTRIGKYTFDGCNGLTSIVVDEENTIYDSRGNCNAIIETASNTLIRGCKNTVIPASVTSIGGNAFLGCTGLTSIEIPESVTSIGNGAFADCTDLTSIEIPSSVTSIGNDAFYWCTGLTSIEISSSVASIGNYAFWGCDGLKQIFSYIAAEDLFAPGDDAFYNVDKTNCTLYVPAGAKSTYAATNGWKEFTNIVETYDLTVTAAGYATLYLGTAVEIPAGVEAYTAGRIEGDFLKMQAVEDVIPANTAVIIKAEEGKYTFIPSNETPEAIEGNLLRGTLIDTYIKPASAQTAYVLSKVDGVVGMYRAKLKADGTFKNNANRVYMLLGDINVGEGNLDTSNPGGQLSNGYRFDFSGTTAIESVENEQQGEAVYYDLSGRRVENPTKGIYIVNGRKVFIK